MPHYSCFKVSFNTGILGENVEVDLVWVFHVLQDRAFNLNLITAHEVNTSLVASNVVNCITIVVVKEHTYSGKANDIMYFGCQKALSTYNF